MKPAWLRTVSVVVVVTEIKYGSQVLAFVNTKREVASFARKIAAQLKKKILEIEMESKGLNVLAEKSDRRQF